MAPIALSNIQIAEISFVKSGANGLEFIAKQAAEGAPPAVVVEIRKTDAAKQAVYGVVYEPDTVDSQGEQATAAEIEKAAWGALQQHAIVKTDHDKPAPAFLAESYLAKAGDPDGYAPGAWAVVVKVEDAALWGQIAKGEFKAFSMGGQALKTPVEKQDPTPAQKSFSVDSMVYATGLEDALKLLQSVATAMSSVAKELGASVEKLKAAPDADSPVAKSMAEMQARLAALDATVTKIAETTTDGRVSSPAPGSGDIDPAKY